jgi:CDP-diacylglycerol---glycerol-3-phosphate 3-phosphatidyltransferase
VLNNQGARRIAAVVIEPPARGLLRLHVTPDMVTIAGTVLVIATALVCLPNGWLIAGSIIIGVLAISDLLDGTMARISGSSGPWGNFLDATLDRLADGAILAGLVMWGALTDQPWLVAGGVFALVMGQVTSYAKARAEAVGAQANVGIAERAERLFVVLLATLLTGLGVPYVLVAALWILGLLGVVTVIQRIVVVRRQLRP